VKGVAKRSAPRSLQRSKDERIELVNHTIVEEVLQDVGTLDFGKGITAKASVALWRERGDHTPLVSEQLFVSVQFAAADWVLPGATKTGIVYRLKGNPPQSHE
jgi:hypothetical protein